MEEGLKPFRFIKDEVCPFCKAAKVADSCRSTHCCGEGFEVREFACGHEIRWKPNMQYFENKPCPKSADEVAKSSNRRIALVQLREFVEKLDIDTEYKGRLQHYIEFA